MNERIKQLAEQAFMVCLKGADEKHLEQLERFAELVRQDEREACAKLCEELGIKWHISGEKVCAAAIRGRTE
jgi:hypothetical protein